MTSDEITRLGHAVLTEGPDPVIYSDRAGVIRFWNAAAARVFGFSAEEALGQSLDIIIPGRLRQRHWDGYHHMMATGSARHPPEELLSVPAQTKHGQALSIQFTVTPLRDAAGRPEGIAAVLRDVTPLFQELKRLRAQA
jgi:PAS domain S-box-containing protein